MVGPIRQIPPAYSAIKLGGRRAYALARAGETPQLEPREVTIDRLELIDWDGSEPDRPIAVVEVDCSAGTYVRSIARDVGAATGGAAYLGALTRTASGRSSSRVHIPLDAIRPPRPTARPVCSRCSCPIDAGLGRFARVVLTEPEIAAIGRGQFVRPAAGLPVQGAADERLIATDATGDPWPWPRSGTAGSLPTRSWSTHRRRCRWRGGAGLIGRTVRRPWTWSSASIA